MYSTKVDLTNARNVYLVGIKGVGMTALAQILQSRGKIVSGSDTEEEFFTDKVLKKLKISYKEGFKAKNLSRKTDLLIYSMAFNFKKHPETIAARAMGIPIISYPEALSSLFNTELGIAVSGTHGKTTTSALIAESLKNLGLEPTALIGSRVVNWQTNAITGKSPFFVIEADEHQNKLKHYRPWSIIITNIDYDHPDFYKKPENYYQAFKKWVGKWRIQKSSVPKIGVFNGDDAKTIRLIRELKLDDAKDSIILTYGKKPNNNIRITNHESRITNNYQTQVLLNINIPSNTSSQTIKIKTSLIGEHNAYNLAAAVAFITGLNIAVRKAETGLKPVSAGKIAASLKNFRGTERRMQFIGKKGKVLVFDDYAHHPEEIRATLAAIKKAYPKHGLFVIFQPHTFTRTQAFLEEFAESLKMADRICLLPVYGSARENSGNVDSRDIAKCMGKKDCACFSDHKSCVAFLKKHKFKNPTILVTMGAGDGWRVGRDYLKNLRLTTNNLRQGNTFANEITSLVVSRKS